MKKVSGPKVTTPEQAEEIALPPRIQEALGELVGATREGLLALSVGVGLSVVHELMELEVDEVVGPKGAHDPNLDSPRTIPMRWTPGVGCGGERLRCGSLGFGGSAEPPAR